MRNILFSMLLFFGCFGYHPLFAQEHPYLFFKKAKIEHLKVRMVHDSTVYNDYQFIHNEAEKALAGGGAKSKIEWLALVYLMDGEQKYALKIKEILLDLCSLETWSNPEMLKRSPAWSSDLKTAENCWTVAVGYDAIYHTLSRSEKQSIVDAVIRMGIRPALDEWVFPSTRIHSLNSMGHNWWSACVGMAGIASMAIMTEHPKAKEWISVVSSSFEEWFAFNGDDLQFKPKTMDNDGGMYESFNYAAFGTSEYLYFRLAFSNTWPQKPQPVIKGLERMANWFMQASYPRTGKIFSLNFGDSDVSTSADRSVKLLEALGHHSPNNLWYLKESENNDSREGLSPKSPLGLLYLPDFSKVPDVPKLPTGAIYKDMGWAMLRNSWKKDQTLLGVKSGYTWNHSHADANSFILLHNGEPIIKDAGNSSYSTKEYPAYFFQSEAHNVMMFNGKAQPKEQQYNGSPLRGRIEQMMDGKGFKYILANATGPTALNFSRNFRSFLWVGKVLLIIDDLKAHQTGIFSFQLHPGGDARKKGGDIAIVNKQSSVLVRPLFPETLVETGFDHDFPEKMKLNEIIAPKARDSQNPTEMYFRIEYPKEVKQTKFMTAVILKDSVNDVNIPLIERLHNETMNGVKITQNGKVTEIYLNLLADGSIMHLNSVNSFSGWETDAYMLGVTYPQGSKQVSPSDVEDYFIGYGSFLRKAGIPVFSSLSKLYMTATKFGNSLDMVLQGQPLIRANFSVGQKPEKFTLNHNPQIVSFNKGILDINISELP